MHPAVSNGAYDVNRIREDFPILAMQVYGKPLVYLDNAASAQKPKAVLDRIQQAYTSEYSNVHRGLHYLANAATEGYEGAREKVRAFLNAPRSEEIIFSVRESAEGGYEAAALGFPIFTEADTLEGLREMVRDAVRCHFDEGRSPRIIRLHLVREEVLPA